MTRRLAIVPAYNEQGAIEALLAELRGSAPDYDVLVVDDASTDETAARAERGGARVIRHPFNLGIGGAVQSGYKHALEQGYDVAVQVDGDGQHDPGQLGLLFAALQDGEQSPDLVCGTRFRGEAGYQVPRSRRLGVLIFAAILSAIVRQRITDPTSGFRMTNRRGIELFAHEYPQDFPEVEAILMLHAHRMRLVEVPVQMRERRAGRSSITPVGSAYYMVRVLLAILVGLFRARPKPTSTDRLAAGLDPRESRG